MWKPTFHANIKKVLKTFSIYILYRVRIIVSMSTLYFPVMSREKQMPPLWRSKPFQVRTRNLTAQILRRCVNTGPLWCLNYLWRPCLCVCVGVFFTEEQTSVDGEEMELGYPITCGDSKAVLLVKKFVCPGINVKCVKVCIWSLKAKHNQLIDILPYEYFDPQDNAVTWTS